MKFTLNWLKEYLKTDASLEEIVEKLTAIGLEVEEVTDKSKELADFKIAQILEAKPHPDADKLQICKVNSGDEELQIVCGAANARAGINVVLAPVGSVIPTNGMKIKASKIRGVESNGMLCSAAELGLGDDRSGIIEMPASNDNIARKYADVVGLSDPVIEIAITPNRGDCLGVYGIARDLAAAGLGELKQLQIDTIKGDFKSKIKIVIDNEIECPMFVGRYFSGVKNGESPDWLKNRLAAIGLRPISALVDITNYIAFEFGRPLHVYDARKIKGNLHVRYAAEGEKIVALDDKEYFLDSEMTVVADSDDEKVQAIAGVIGGAESGCDENTTEVFLEVALFNPVSVASTGRKLDIITDSRYRFERTVDPAFVKKAVEIATKMIIDICGGEASEPVVAGEEPKWQRELMFDLDYTRKRSGIFFDGETCFDILRSLGFGVNMNHISIPSWRSDIEGKADIVEEIVRIYGYDKIPTLALPNENKGFAAVLNPSQRRVSDVRRTLAARGLTEAITWSFMKSAKAKLFGADSDELKLLNPISSDLDVMRPSILPNLLDAVARNNDRGHENLSFFEIGLIFENTTPKGQRQVASAVRSGRTSEKDTYGTSRDVDVFDAKADCLAALETAGVPVDNLRITTDAASYYHPGRSGVLRLGKAILGVFGEIHPKILKVLDVKVPAVGFEIFFDNLPDVKNKGKSRTKLEVSEYQSSSRDFAFLIDADIAVGDILQSVRRCDKTLIREVSLFDVYQGKGVAENKKSIAFSVKIQAADHTLTEDEIGAISKKVIDAVSQAGGELRG
ncbi:MAG: phenylalanine--tRNA ligase subunit beta [Rickettsiales bacterium]|nr:phenylalanine--tRNA ligase subunit beta [Pseudomonadota bacterium]MDA0966464.1 phenylalanine--tRNA ligase subunit beta [Pseudomonadota bacterium]MDG4543326.1 phenylalanine--tRNA ligase subunit beta [Rickettsiales bacterium]MDG4545592.1 phenylalanine--tRNA ligase subunit beta [Rickettsiales bacterium]MDG4548041.1 phenylalanine--tRNA ligase subunit beta [Rickettsiales bacterium]